MSRGIVGKLQGKVLDNLKKSKKPLDNGLPPWYNKNVKRGYTPPEPDRHQTAERKTDRQRAEGFSKKFFKNFEKSIDKAC